MADAADQVTGDGRRRPISIEAAAGGLLSALERLGAAYALGNESPSERAAAWEQAIEPAAQATGCQYRAGAECRPAPFAGPHGMRQGGDRPRRPIGPAGGGKQPGSRDVEKHQHRAVDKQARSMGKDRTAAGMARPVYTRERPFRC